MAQETNHIGDGSKMVTAVDWLMWWMGKNQYFIGNDLLQAVKIAKSIEKEHVIDAFIDGEHQQGYVKEAEQYYNEKYGE
jgi:hypothetical protein